MKNLIAVIVLLFNGCFVFGQKEMNVVPRPAEIKFEKGNTRFILSQKTKIYLGHNSIAVKHYADYLNKFIELFY